MKKQDKVTDKDVDYSNVDVDNEDEDHILLCIMGDLLLENEKLEKTIISLNIKIKMIRKMLD